MKHTFEKLLIFALLVCSWGICVHGTEQISKSMKVTLSTAFPPQARTTGTVGSNVSNSRSAWLQVDLKFKTDEEKIASKRFLDKPQLDVQIVTYPGRNYNRKASKRGSRRDVRRDVKVEKIVVFNGKIDYITLECDGREHYLKALLPAVLFRRYAYDRQLEQTDFVVKASYSAGGKVLATAYGGSKGIAEKDIKNFFRTLPKNVVTAADTVYGRQGTSWSVIEVNKYEMEKIR